MANRVIRTMTRRAVLVSGGKKKNPALHACNAAKKAYLRNSTLETRVAFEKALNGLMNVDAAMAIAIQKEVRARLGR